MQALMAGTFVRQEQDGKEEDAIGVAEKQE